MSAGALVAGDGEAGVVGIGDEAHARIGGGVALHDLQRAVVGAVVDHADLGRRRSRRAGARGSRRCVSALWCVTTTAAMSSIALSANSSPLRRRRRRAVAQHRVVQLPRARCAQRIVHQELRQARVPAGPAHGERIHVAVERRRLRRGARRRRFRTAHCASPGRTGAATGRSAPRTTSRSWPHPGRPRACARGRATARRGRRRPAVRDAVGGIAGAGAREALEIVGHRRRSRRCAATRRLRRRCSTAWRWRSRASRAQAGGQLREPARARAAHRRRARRHRHRRRRRALRPGARPRRRCAGAACSAPAAACARASAR